MTRRAPRGPIVMGFERESLRIAIADIQPLRFVSPAVKKTAKYVQIVASIREVGIIEPPVVSRTGAEEGKYLLLDGHLRVEALKDTEATEVTCLISTDDEAFTYNRHVSRLAIIQEHKMIVKAIERGVSPKRIAQALNVNPATLGEKIRLLDGICPEAAELLKDRHVPIGTFRALRKMMPLRQIEAAELMIAMNSYSNNYAKSLLAATRQSQLIESERPKKVKGLTEEQMALMERESSNLEREFRMAEQSYGTDHLDLVLVGGYLNKLLANGRVVRYLAQHHAEILPELQKLVDAEPAQP